MDAFAGGPGVLLGYGKKEDNLCLWDMGEEMPIQRFQGAGPLCLVNGKPRGAEVLGNPLAPGIAKKTPPVICSTK